MDRILLLLVETILQQQVLIIDVYEYMERMRICSYLQQQLLSVKYNNQINSGYGSAIFLYGYLLVVGAKNYNGSD